MPVRSRGPAVTGRGRNPSSRRRKSSTTRRMAGSAREGVWVEVVAIFMGTPSTMRQSVDRHLKGDACTCSVLLYHIGVKPEKLAVLAARAGLRPAVSRNETRARKQKRCAREDAKIRPSAGIAERCRSGPRMEGTAADRPIGTRRTPPYIAERIAAVTHKDRWKSPRSKCPDLT